MSEFNFQMDESFLKAYLEYVQHLKKEHPGQEIIVQISIDLIPDGVGYEASAPRISVLDAKSQQNVNLQKDMEYEEEIPSDGGLHQCPYCYDLVYEDHEEFCSLNPNRNEHFA